MYRERSNGKDYFKMEIEEGQALDMIAIRMMEENVMQGIMPFRKVNTMEGTYFEYEVPGQDNLNDWLAVIHGKNEVINVLNSLIQINDEAEVNLLETNHLYTEKEWISVANNRCYMAYIPYVSYSNDGLLKLAEEIINKVSVLQNENFNYIYDLRNAFSSDEIVSMVDLKKWLNSVQGQEEVKQQGENYQDYGMGQRPVAQEQIPMQGQQPMAGQNMWNNSVGMNGMQSPVQNQMGVPNEPFGAMNGKKKEEKGPKKPLFAKKEKSVAPMQQAPGIAGGSPFDEFFDNASQKKAVPQIPSDIPSGMNGVNQGNKPVQGNIPNQKISGIPNQPMPPMGQPMAKEEKAKSGGKFKMPSFGGKKQAEPPMGQPMPANGRKPMPPMGQSMPPMGQPMPPMGQPMPPMGQPMPLMGQPMSPMGQPMPPMGQPVPPNGRIINELEFENDGTVLMSQNSSGSIRCKDFPNGLSLDKDSYILGIGQQADIRITGNSTVSRKHARIYKQAGAFYIVDEGSLNGTYVNNRQLMAHEPCKLEDGAKILLSDENIIFEAR